MTHTSDELIPVYRMKPEFAARTQVPEAFRLTILGPQADVMTSDTSAYVWFVDGFCPDGKTPCSFWLFASRPPVAGHPYERVAESAMFDRVEMPFREYWNFS